MTDYQRDEIAKIHIQDLRLRTYIGINDDEKKNQQDVVINIRIHYHAEKAVSFNVIDEALNYRTITKKVIKHVESNRFLRDRKCETWCIYRLWPLLARAAREKYHRWR